MNFDSMYFAFDFFTHRCSTCLSIDYETSLEHDGQLIRRKPIPMAENVELKQIPNNLQTKIIEKMDQRSFCRMRRTEKQISNFIQGNREALKIPLFHHMEIVFNPKKDDGDGPEVSFLHPLDALLSEKTKYSDYMRSLEGFKESEFSQFSGAVKAEIGTNGSYDIDRPMTTVSLRQWKSNPELRKELSGVYHAAAINFGSFKSEAEIHLVCDFMLFAGLTKNKLIVNEMSDKCLERLCKETEPVGLAICNGRYSEEIFMQHGFETLRELILYQCSPTPTVSHMDKLQRLHIDLVNDNNADSSIILADAVQCIQKWRQGTMALNEMVLNGNRALKTTDFGGSTPSEEEKKRMAEHFSLRTRRSKQGCKIVPEFGLQQRTKGRTFDLETSSLRIEITYRDPIDACILQCETFGKTAILCCGEMIYFKEL